MYQLARLSFAVFLLGLFPPSWCIAADGEGGIDDLLKTYSRDRGTLDVTVQGLVKLMEASPDDPGVPKAFAWLIRHGGVSEASDYDMSEAFLKRIEEHHRDNDQLAAALITMIGFREEEPIAFFERLGEESQSELVSGTALLALASSFEHDSKNIGRYETALQMLLEKHPGLKYGRRDISGYAKQKLFASQNLRIGKEAPEVEGKDAQGKSFKLSDYRGKIVFFNFWGDW